MYVDDYNDLMPPNLITVAGGTFVSLPGSWLLGNAKLDTTTSNIEHGLLFSYNRSAAIYHCPSDRSKVTGRRELLRTRSYQLNNYLATLLNGSSNGRRYRTRYSQLISPPPAQIWTFLDAHEDVISSGDLFIDADSNQWVDLPADRHNQGCSLAFADGHAEHYHWRAPKKAAAIYGPRPPYNRLDRADFERLKAGVPDP
jgi:prepilin-type processing-associated H-X9-DG protein